MSGRKDKIMETAKKVFPEQFEKSREETIRRCEENSSKIAEEFLVALKEAAKQAIRQRENSNGDDVLYILFSCLYSSIFLKKYLIRIDLMGKEFYNTPPLAVSYWDAGNIYCLFEKDIEEISGKVRKEVPRIRKYEEDYIRYAYAPYYSRIVKVFIREMLEEILTNSRRTPDRNDAGEKEVKILFGEYMGEADILFSVGRENIYEIFQNIC